MANDAPNFVHIYYYSKTRIVTLTDNVNLYIIVDV